MIELKAKPEDEQQDERHEDIGKNLTTFIGFIGFAAFVGPVALYLFKLAQTNTDTLSNYRVLMLIFSLDVLLLLASRLNDFLIVYFEKRAIAAITLICSIVGLLGLVLSDYWLICDFLLALATALLTLIWGQYLSVLTHRTLFFAFSAASIFVGLLVVFATSLNSTVTTVIAAFLILLSWFCLLIIKPTINKNEPVSRKVSIKRNYRGRSNRFTLIAIGMILGAVISILSKLSEGFELEQDVLIGLSIAASGILLLVLMTLVHKYFEDALLRIITIITAALLLPLPFVSVLAQVILACLLAIFIIIHFIFIVCAIAETTRFNMISYIWIFGCELFFLLLGACVAAAASIWVFSFEEQGNETLLVFIIGTVIISSVMQVFVQAQSYPLKKDFDIGLVAGQNQDSAMPVAAGGNAVWKDRINVLAVERELSPRQREVLEILVKGRDTNYIMEYFVISRATAKTHVYNLYKKLEVHSRQQLLDLVEQVDSEQNFNS